MMLVIYKIFIEPTTTITANNDQQQPTQYTLNRKLISAMTSLAGAGTLGIGY